MNQWTGRQELKSESFEKKKQIKENCKLCDIAITKNIVRLT